MKTEDFDGHMRMCYFQIKLTGEEGKATLATLLEWSMSIFHFSAVLFIAALSSGAQKDYNETENLVKWARL